MSARLADPIALGSLQLPNRLYRAPVLEGAGSARDPAAAYAQHFVPNVAAGLGLVIQGNTIVLPEGRTSPGMSAIGERARMLALSPLTRAVHEAGGKIVIQLGHGGLFALEGWHRDFKPGRTAPPLAPSPTRMWMRAIQRSDTTILSTDEVARLAERFGVVAAWAREAGYDGVQLAGSNAKLLHQFLSPTFNRRKDRYGGDVVGRTTFIREIRDAIAREAGADYPVLLKYTAVEETPFGRGIDLEEGVQVARIAEQAGFCAVTPVIADALPNTSICRGEFPRPPSTTPPCAAACSAPPAAACATPPCSSACGSPRASTPSRRCGTATSSPPSRPPVDIPVFAVGGIRTPQEAAEILAQGHADMIGIGRPFYAEPDLAAPLPRRGPRPSVTTACESCNRCIVPQMLGMPGVCYNPEIHKIRRRRADRRAPRANQKVAVAPPRGPRSPHLPEPPELTAPASSLLLSRPHDRGRPLRAPARRRLRQRGHHRLAADVPLGPLRPPRARRLGPDHGRPASPGS
jgi:2,4-dienoyl-CoA reductase-like NADH-dependent reductase (Old Yellow Enzyme family)